jgi:hypothetical protein
MVGVEAGTGVVGKKAGSGISFAISGQRDGGAPTSCGESLALVRIVRYRPALSNEGTCL